MKYLGIDTAARLTARQAAAAKAAGVAFVGRYLVPPGYSKALTAEEIAAVRGEHLALLLCWETDAAAMARGEKQGAADGAAARALAEGFGVPPGTAVYFAADWDVDAGQLSACEAYLRAAQSALGPYAAGIYGGERVVAHLTAHGIRQAWQCAAWSRRFSDAAQIRQYAWQGAPESRAMAAKIGAAVDMDAAEDLAAAGLWLPEPAQPWYADALAWASASGVATGGRPEAAATRAEVMQMLRNYHRRFGGET